jgi:hypothetical protein
MINPKPATPFQFKKIGPPMTPMPVSPPCKILTGHC